MEALDPGIWRACGGLEMSGNSGDGARVSDQSRKDRHSGTSALEVSVSAYRG